MCMITLLGGLIFSCRLILNTFRTLLSTKQNILSQLVCLNYYKKFTKYMNVHDYNIYAQLITIMSYFYFLSAWIYLRKLSPILMFF